MPFAHIKDMATEAKAISTRLEPENTLVTTAQMSELYA